MSTTTNTKIIAAVLTDSYKASHYYMYPDSTEMVAYGEFRRSFEKDPNDSRLIYYGMRHIIENYVNIPWTEADVIMAEQFYNTHNVNHTSFPFPKELFLKFVKENNGHFPVRIESLPEGTVCHKHVPVYQITARDEYARLVTFLESILTQIWYPSTVATLSRRVKDTIHKAFVTSVEPELHFLLDSRLHDFGFRGCTTVEQSIIGGCSHLLSFSGSDTLSACFHAQYVLNEGRPVGSSIPATEHSVMTAWKTEEEAIRNTIKQFGGPGRIFSVVMDSYDYSAALWKTLPRITPLLKEVGGTMVIRPDSGDPVECVLEALRAGEAAGGSDMNALGYKVLRHFNVIQGDGINSKTIETILEAVLAAGYSAQNVAFGMGGGLLQKVNRDTMSFATKLSYLRDLEGVERDVMKKPLTDKEKYSLPGILHLRRFNIEKNEIDETMPITVWPNTSDHDDIVSKNQVNKSYSGDKDNELKIVYDCGKPIDFTWDTFDCIKNRVETQWNNTPKNYDVISPQLRVKMDTWTQPKGGADATL